MRLYSLGLFACCTSSTDTWRVVNWCHHYWMFWPQNSTYHGVCVCGGGEAVLSRVLCSSSYTSSVASSAFCTPELRWVWSRLLWLLLLDETHLYTHVPVNTCIVFVILYSNLCFVFFVFKSFSDVGSRSLFNLCYSRFLCCSVIKSSLNLPVGVCLLVWVCVCVCGISTTITDS